MIEPLDKRIDRFNLCFQDYLSEISQINNHYQTIHFQRILYIVVLSELSAVIKPDLKDRERMVYTLSKFSDWKFFDRISLPNLVHFLKLAPKPAFEALYLYSMDKQKEWIDEGVIMLDRDISINEISKLWPKNDNYYFLVQGKKTKIVPDFFYPCKFIL